MPTLPELDNLIMGQLQTITGVQVFKIDAKPAAGRDYIVYHPTPGHEPVARYASAYGPMDWEFRLVCASHNANGVPHVVSKARTAFLGWRPTPELRGSSAVRETPTGAVILTDRTNPSVPIYSTTLTLTHHTVRN